MKPSVLKGFRLYRHFPGVQIFFADVTPTHSCQSEVRVHGGVGWGGAKVSAWFSGHLCHTKPLIQQHGNPTASGTEQRQLFKFKLFKLNCTVSVL